MPLFLAPFQVFRVAAPALLGIPLVPSLPLATTAVEIYILRVSSARHYLFSPIGA